MNNYINKLLNKEDYNSIKLFKNLVYFISIYYFTSLIPISKELWGTYNLAPPCDFGFPYLYFSTCIFGNNSYIFLYLFLYTFYALFLFKDSLISRILLSWTIEQFYLHNSGISDGGNTIISLLTLYIIFLPSSDEKKDTFSLRKISKTCFYSICKFQVCILYFISGATKAFSPAWSKGTALYYSLLNPDYSLPVIYNNLQHIPDFIIVLPNYLILLYQLFFPLLIINPRTKKMTLILGFVFHISIGIIMGLWFFGASMIVCHSVFYDEEFSRRILASIKKYKTKIVTKGLSWKETLKVY